MLRLAAKLELIQATGILNVDLSWLNNNYQRSLTRCGRRCSADRMRKLREEHRYTVLVCFLWQVYRDTIDHMIDTHHKLMTRIYNHAQDDVDEQTRKQRRMIRNSLTTLHILGQMILDAAIADESLRQTLFNKVDREKLTAQMADVETWLTGKYSHVFNLVVERFPYIRQFAPTLLDQLDFRLEEGAQSTIVEAVKLLQQMNEDNKRKLPDDAPLGFIPKNSYANVGENGWQLSVDPSNKLDEAGKQRLEELKAWLAKNMRNIRLPELLIEVDNELHVTHHFMTPQQQQQRTAEDVCTILVTIMAHGCNVGPYTMSRD